MGPKTATKKRSAPATAEEEDRDREEEDDEDSAEELQSSSEAIPRQPGSLARQKAKRPRTEAPRERQQRTLQSEPGVIQEITVENFMCHRKLKVKLNPSINFITGQNGSGKSAILCALQICLGASAKVTHRGRGLRDLIRHGSASQPAYARVTLCNTGSDAYRPEDFGAAITIERKILPSGASEYRLMGETGQVVSKKRADLIALLDRFNIQIDNPCAVLDQEEAKRFIKGSNKDKYSFFLRATELKKTKELYSEARHHLEVMETVLEQQKRKLETIRREAAEAKKRCEEAGRMKELEEEASMLTVKLARTKVYEEEAKLSEKRKALTAEQTKYQKYLDALEAQKQREEREREQLREKQREMEALNEEFEERKKEEERLVKVIQEKKNPLRNLETQVRGLQRRIAHQQAQQREAISELSRLQNEALSQNKEKKARQQETLLRAEEELERRKEDQAKHGQDQESLRQEIEKKREEERRCNELLQQATQYYEKASDRLKSLKSQKNNRAALFGPRMGALLSETQKNIRRFQAPPIGPIGMHINLPERNRQWGTAIEACIGKTLSSFIIQRAEDKPLMDQLKHKVGMRPGEANTLIVPRSDNRYSQLRLPEGELRKRSIALLLDIEVDVVFNGLIDHTNMESKVVFDSMDQLRSLMLLGKDGSLQTPRGVKEGYIPDGSKVYVRNGNHTFIAGGRERASRLTTNVEEQIKVLTEQVDTYRREMDFHRRSLQEVRDAARTLKQELEAVNKLHLKNVRLITQAENRVKDIREALVEETEVDTSALEEEVRLFKESILDLIQKKEMLEERVKERQDELQPYEEQLHAFRSDESMQEKHEVVLRQLEEMIGSLETLKRKGEVLGRKVEEKRARASQEEAECKECEEKLEETRAKAAQVEQNENYRFAERIRLGESSERVKEALQVAKARIQEHRARFNVLDFVELTQAYEDLQRKLQAKEAVFESVLDNERTMATLVQKRERDLKDSIGLVSHTISQEFNFYLLDRNMTGGITFNHKEETLEFKVTQNIISATAVGENDVSTFSGGERSTVQLAFLSAVGSFSSCPFRVMDEFDVFMDSKNRTLALRGLVDMGLMHPRSQFIFITPNDVSSLDLKEAGDRVSIHMLRAARDAAGPSSREEEANLH